MIPLLYLAPIEWTSLWQRPQQLATRLARTFDLRYVNPVGLRGLRAGDVPRLIERLWTPGVRVPANESSQVPRPSLIHPRYLPIQGLPGLSRLNRNWLKRQIQRQFAPLSSPGQDWILWLSTPSLLAQTLVETDLPHRPRLVIYDAMDHYAAFHQGRTRQRIAADEQRLVPAADIVLASARSLAARLQPLARVLHVVPNGVEHGPFAADVQHPLPEALSALPRPLIGFHGTLGNWLDYELLARLAQARPGWSWVFVGPAAAAGTARLAHLPNVHLLGAVPFDQLPAYTTRFTAGIIPFVDNELTRGVHPIKALEYLAAGIPIVASRLPDLAPLGDLIQFADTTGDWLAQLDQTVQVSSDQPTLAARRRATAAEHTWDSRADEIVALIQDQLRQPAQDRPANDGRAAA